MAFQFSRIGRKKKIFPHNIVVVVDKRRKRKKPKPKVMSHLNALKSDVELRNRH